MTYSPPASNAVSFNFASSASAPASNAVSFAFGRASTTAALTGAQAASRAGSVTFMKGRVASLTGAHATTRPGVVWVDDVVHLVGAKCGARAGAIVPVGSMHRRYVFDVPN
ncbi:hypothetical protein [Paraburkholderia tuberum]|uniref:Uncharacterized protein n=1 Tax=Paraburkholderia tuberum TaxID=157910 RepID=A0A1H1JB39_9BURK|nr:hypothetical protein [Paraburkholderia tuberum]SDR46990.1 hypothetical protein SAMN05445850_4493 [Paraburkholderia tuberum]